MSQELTLNGLDSLCNVRFIFGLGQVPVFRSTIGYIQHHLSMSSANHPNANGNANGNGP
jgi:hypothetical protein